MDVSKINTLYNEAVFALFSAQIESGCKLMGTNSQRRKFHMAVSKVTHEAVQEIREIVISLSPVNPYENLWDKLITRTSIFQGKK